MTDIHFIVDEADSTEVEELLSEHGILFRTEEE